MTYKPRLSEALEIENPDNLNLEIRALIKAREELTTAIKQAGAAEGVNSEEFQSFATYQRDIETRLSQLEPQTKRLVIYERIVGSLVEKSIGTLEATKVFKTFAVSATSKALVAPFDDRPQNLKFCGLNNLPFDKEYAQIVDFVWKQLASGPKNLDQIVQACKQQPFATNGQKCEGSILLAKGCRNFGKKDTFKSGNIPVEILCRGEKVGVWTFLLSSKLVKI